MIPGPSQTPPLGLIFSINDDELTQTNVSFNKGAGNTLITRLSLQLLVLNEIVCKPAPETFTLKDQGKLLSTIPLPVQRPS